MACKKQTSTARLITAFERRSVLHAVSNSQISAFENSAIQQFEIDLLLHLVKERNARAEQNGMNIEHDFIDQAGFKQAFRQFSATKRMIALVKRSERVASV